jgi:hypothetical protein
MPAHFHLQHHSSPTKPYQIFDSSCSIIWTENDVPAKSLKKVEEASTLKVFSLLFGLGFGLVLSDLFFCFFFPSVFVAAVVSSSLFLFLCCSF